MKLIELNKIFNIEAGNKFDLNKMKQLSNIEEAVTFIGRSGRDNGVTAYVERKSEIKPYKAGLITVALGGAILSSFVQPKPFYTGQNMVVLIPIAPMDLPVKLYYCLCIRANKHRYGAFGREANRTLKTLLVPTVESIPTWVYNSTQNVQQEWETSITTLISQSSQ